MKNENQYLDEEERDFFESFTSSEINPRIPSAEEQQKYKRAAESFLAKETKMNIRIDPVELDLIKERAAIEGLRYQTLVKSILHKYVTGQLIERRTL